MHINFRKQISDLVDLQVTAFDVVKRYIRGHIAEIDLFILLAVLLFVLSKLPYFNIILEKYFISFILIVSAVYIFRISKRAVVWFTLGLFVVAWGLTLTGDTKGAEQTGNLIYFLLWFNVLLYGKDIWRA